MKVSYILVKPNGELLAFREPENAILAQCHEGGELKTLKFEEDILRPQEAVNEFSGERRSW